MTETITLNNKQNIIRRIADDIFLLAVALYLMTVDLIKTTIKLGLPEYKIRFLLVFLAAAAVIRLAILLIDDRDAWKFWGKYILIALLICAVYYMVYHDTSARRPIFLALITLGSIGIHYDRLLKMYLAAASTIVLSAILMAWLGAINNLVYLRDMNVRSSWGIIYPTDMMTLLFFLLLAFWIVSRKKSDYWFLIPAVILLIMSRFVADSNTSTMCNAAFILILLIHRGYCGGKHPGFNKFVRFCALIAFPLFTVLTNAMVLAYKAGYPFMAKVNDLMTNRLQLTVDAFDKYGFSLFGKEVIQVGNSGTTFVKPDYAFVDISYCLILLSFGIVALVMFNILWVMMTRKAFRLGDSRLALALALIAFNAMSEHHISQINFNLFLAIPFAILTLREEACIELKPVPRRNVLVQMGVSILILVAVTAGILAALPGARTLVTLLDLGASHEGRRLLFAACVIGIWLLIAAIVAAYRLIAPGLCSLGTRAEKQKAEGAVEEMESAEDTASAGTAENAEDTASGGTAENAEDTASAGTPDRTEDAAGAERRNIAGGPHRIRNCVLVLLLFAVVCGAGVWAGNSLIQQKADSQAEMIGAESGIIKEALSAKAGKLYVTDLPSLYRKQFGGISSSLYNGEDLARFTDTTVIIDRDLDSLPLFGTGFLYTELSDRHAIYTNDRKVVKALEKKGCHFKSYYPILTKVGMKKEAKRNHKTRNEDGSITLRGEGQKLSRGPRADLRQGRYTFTVDLSLDPREAAKYTAAKNSSSRASHKKDLICRIKGTARKGEDTLFETPVYSDQFDAQGEFISRTIRTIPDSRKVDIKVLPAGDRTVTVKGMSYQKTPEYDIHGFYNGERVRYLEEFFDLDGKPATKQVGYFARKLGYDAAGNVDRESYYDESMKPMLDLNGCAQLRREYNDQNKPVKEYYYGLDGKRITLPRGQAITEFAYDSAGHQTDVMFYDMKERPTTVGGDDWGGYFRTHRSFDEDWNVIRVDYFDTNDRPVLLKEGYTSIEYSYDPEGNVIETRYYDLAGNEVQIGDPEEDQ